MDVDIYISSLYLSKEAIDREMKRDFFLDADIKEFISVDWGTSNLRIRLVNRTDLEIKQELHFPKGIKSLYLEWRESGEERESYYLRFLKSCLQQLQFKLQPENPLVISGMASSSIGLRELAYAQVPFGPKGKELYVEQIESNELECPVLLISGVQTFSDVIRGEEVQMIGLIEKNASLKELFIIPGTHSKHMWVENKQVVDFKTYMTGEVFDVIENHTVLRDLIQRGKMGETEAKAFVNGVKEASSQKSILHTLFKVRTNSLLHHLPLTENYYFLSGILIGEELRGLKKEKQLNIKLCASGGLSDLYILAIEALELQDQIEVVQKELVDHAVVKGQNIILNYFYNEKYEKI